MRYRHAQDRSELLRSRASGRLVPKVSPAVWDPEPLDFDVHDARELVDQLTKLAHRYLAARMGVGSR